MILLSNKRSGKRNDIGRGIHDVEKDCKRDKYTYRYRGCLSIYSNHTFVF